MKCALYQVSSALLLCVSILRILMEWKLKSERLTWEFGSVQLASLLPVATSESLLRKDSSALDTPLFLTIYFWRMDF